jgi:hypothetical protein
MSRPTTHDRDVFPSDAQVQKPMVCAAGVRAPEASQTDRPGFSDDVDRRAERSEGVELDHVGDEHANAAV